MAADSTTTTSGPDSSEQAVGPPAGRLRIIGIGASAGGLTALRNFFRALPGDTGLTFVVVVHLSPEHESVLAELLQPYTDMPVTQVTGAVQMQPNAVYVIPPGQQLVVSGQALELREFVERRSRPLQIDAFFRSLAEEYGDGAAVILSGSGSDGAVGMQAIKEKGGLLLVQSPDEAEYDGMPRSAIATGLVDIVAPVAELAEQLVAAKQTGATIHLPVNGEGLSDTIQQTLTQILAQVRVRTGHDFSGYKTATVLRRITRRLQLTQLTTLTAYLHRLRHDNAEAEALFRDLLINVTEFFRDPEAWAALETTVIPQLFAGKGRDDTVRVWTVDCATGEEAYSLTMLLLEYADELIAPPTIQVFASDLGEAALYFAREGSYPEAIAADLSETRLARFFTKENSHYRVRPELREPILFAQHNLLQDPPFSKLDLVVCRNLLIYIQRDLQERIFETFYYALRPGGFLFLGNAESAEDATELFDTLDKRQRLYQRSAQKAALPILPLLPLLPRTLRLPAGAPVVRSPGEEHGLMLEAVAPPSVLVDREYNVLHLSQRAGRYLLPPDGPPTVDIVKLVRPELQNELRTALFRVFERNQAVATRPLAVRFNGAPHFVYLMVRPHQLAGGQPRALVIFWEDETPVEVGIEQSNIDEQNEQAQQHWEAQLRQVQGRLQSMREEYETTFEELRAANEELQSTNEEYKSTLEELETSKEELQSINEELQTINQELKTKVEEVSQAHGDLQNLFAATDIATIFLDRELRVKRYTPRATELFNLMPTDRGRPIAHMRSNLHYDELEADARGVIKDLVPLERELQSQNGLWFLMRMRPYRTVDDRIDGVVITFADVTELKRVEAALRQSEEFHRLAVEAGQLGTWDMDLTTGDCAFSPHMATLMGYSPNQQFVPLTQWLASIHPADRPRIEQTLTALTTTEGGFEFEFRIEPAAGRVRWLYSKGSVIGDAGGALHLRGASIDITDRKEAEASLHQFNETLEQRVAERTAALRTRETQLRELAGELAIAEQAERRRISQILHDDLQQYLYGIRMLVKIISEEAEESNLAQLVQYAQQAYGLLDDAVNLTRQLTVDLSPPVLQEADLTHILQWLAAEMRQVHALQVEVHSTKNFGIADEGTRILLFQIVRELLFNVVKHAQTNQAVVELLEGDDDQLLIQVIDQGRGFEPDAMNGQPTVHFGLFSVQERLALFGGHMAIASAPGQGTRITLTVPAAPTAS